MKQALEQLHVALVRTLGPALGLGEVARVGHSVNEIVAPAAGRVNLYWIAFQARRRVPQSRPPLTARRGARLVLRVPLRLLVGFSTPPPRPDQQTYKPPRPKPA
jgi:hypothetical protein